MGCFIGKIVPYFTRKCTILNIYFPNFSGGNTPGPPLREGPCAGAQVPPFVVPPMFSTNRRPCLSVKYLHVLDAVTQQNHVINWTKAIG